MMRFLPVFVGCTVVAASAIDYGRHTGRWFKDDDLEAVVARVKQVKPELGDWKSRSIELDAHSLEVARIAGYISRTYVNRLTGAEVQVLLVCGRPGPISVHTPDICYAGAGYVPSDNLKKQTIGDDQFCVGKFVKGPPIPEPLCIFWSWMSDGQWKAPDNPRATFGRNTGTLCKLYVIHRSGPGDEASTPDSAAMDFLQVLLPELKRCLASPL